jgi:hypothetical protein
MLRITGRTWGVTLIVGLLGALLGFGLDLALHTEGWTVVAGSMGLCAGAAFAGALATPEPPRRAPAEAPRTAEAGAASGAPTE